MLSIDLGDATDEYETAYYGVGCYLTVEGNYTDLSTLKSVRFDAKGSGTMNLKFLTEVTDGYEWGDMAAAFNLASSWQAVSISVDDIAPEPWSPTAEDKITWDDVKGAVTQLRFETNGDKMKAGDHVDFAVDNIVFVGVDYSDFEWDGFPSNYLYRYNNPFGKKKPEIIARDKEYVALGSVYDIHEDLGYAALDFEDGNLTSLVTVVGEVNSAVAGSYIVLLSVKDSDGMSGEKKVEVIVEGKQSILDISPSDQFNIENLVVGPMPITDASKVFYIVEESGLYTLELYTASEKLVASTKVSAVKGKNEITWAQLNSVERGIYYIALKKGNEQLALTRIFKGN